MRKRDLVREGRSGCQLHVCSVPTTRPCATLGDAPPAPRMLLCTPQATVPSSPEASAGIDFSVEYIAYAAAAP